MHGIYALNHSTFDLWLTAIFGVAGYLLRSRGFEPAPLLLALVATTLPSVKRERMRLAQEER